MEVIVEKEEWGARPKNKREKEIEEKQDLTNRRNLEGKCLCGRSSGRGTIQRCLCVLEDTEKGCAL